METVTVSRSIDAEPAAVLDAMEDVGSLMAAAGFDEVDVEGDAIRVANRMGVTTIELTLVLIDDPAGDLVYEQREGIFETMRTVHTVTPTPEGSEVTITTDFALDVALIGEVLDATVIKRQRRKELEAQLDWLETAVSD